MSSRGFWPMRDLPVVGWLVASVAAVLVHPFVPAPRWLMIHLLVLGAAGHAILVWSRYFADTLLRLPPSPRRLQNLRLGLFNLGVVAVVAGVVGDRWPTTLAGGVAVTAAVGWHGTVLLGQLRRALGSRFASSVRYYVAAAALLPLGVALGVWLARGPADPWQQRAQLAHVSINLLGWIGLTVLGTLVTLWPTMLRTRIAEGAEQAARRALPVLVLGVLVTAASSLAGQRPGVVVGLVCYLAGMATLAVPAVSTARRKPPLSFATFSTGAGVVWFAGCTAVLATGAAAARSWAALERLLDDLTPLLAVGFAAQVLLGASSYLLPVVRGGGPAAVRAANRVLDSGGPLRLVVTNLGLLVCALPVPSLVRVVVSVVVLIALASFLPLLVLSLRAAGRTATSSGSQAHARTTPGSLAPPDGPGPRGSRRGLAATGLAVVLLAVAAGAALDPAALGRPTLSASAGVAATGETTAVTVVAKGMRFHPASVQVPAGNRLVVTLRNESAGDVHDLVLESGADTGRIAPGHSAKVDVGVVGRSLDGWCSVVGHRQMGMVFAVEVADGVRAAGRGRQDDTRATGHAAHEDDRSTEPAVLDPMAEPAAGFRAPDARLPALEPGRVHRRTLRVTESEHEVAPGVRQRLWTYDGTAPGPTLHGQVGDVFEITLVNDGTVGHSVDFHAGALAPDRPTRTIAPGERLVYRFTATRAGIWMYHCSTMPMSAHIANGLFGAVVIDPPDLPRADRSFVLTQSELYFGPDGGTLDTASLAAGRPSAVAFNGYAFGYDHDPIRVRPGERVRIWLLDAGPDRASSFHVVGGQFDRVWTEGRYVLGSATSPAHATGAQVLPLAPAQGGFVELVFPEEGHFPFVSHVMSDAERGAHGIFDVR